MTTFTTYQSANAANPNELWVAYVNQWKVFCFGATEQEAKDKALAFWQKARAQSASYVALKSDGPSDKAEPSETPKAGRGHANTGKIWMRHSAHGLVRVPLTEIAMYEKNGYYRSGPRSK